MNARAEAPARGRSSHQFTSAALRSEPWWRGRGRSLKLEIGLAFGVVIALMFGLGAAFHLSEQRSVAAIDKLLNSDGRMADLSLRGALAMQKARGAESDFLRSVETLGAVEARERLASALQTHLQDLREYLTSVRIIASNTEFRDRIDHIERQAHAYEVASLAFAERYGEAGQAGAANRAQQDAIDAALAIEPLLEDLHTVASKRALQTRSGVERAASVTRWTVGIAVAIATLLGATVALIFSRRITGSLAQLIAFSKQVAAGDLGARAPHSGEREFAILARAMNQMAESLEQSQAQLLAAARVAGMAEIATNVLHNVGNVLNSVNVSAGLVGEQLRTSRLGGLTRAVDLLDVHAGDLGAFLTSDAKGKLLPIYLRELAQALQGEHAAMAEELDTLARSVDHIKEVVATQQSYAGSARVVQSLDLAELVDDALRMNAGALTRHKVEVVRDLANLPALPLDRHRMLQILVNLISNAKHAMDGAAVSSPCITLAARLMDGGTLRITVADNGEGIAPQNLTRVFSHGFTTRSNGHGFGLHSCVLAAQEMGGRLSAHSDGAGRGAIFALDIPIDAPEGSP